jgi:DNA-binding NarL/FixJ family response regulator
MSDTIYLIGDNFLTGEALQSLLKNKGYEVHIGSVEGLFGEKAISDLEADILIWQEELIELRKKTLFELWSKHTIPFRSIFILSTKTFAMLGVGLTKGIQGYVHKRGGVEELVSCVNAVKQGSVFISPFFLKVNGIMNPLERNNKIPGVDLTNQEETVLQFVSQKKTST